MPFQSPFESPNAIPPRTSSHGIPNGLKHRSSVLRPLSEVDWLSQSKKSKLHHSPSAPLDPPLPETMDTQTYPTPSSPPPPDPLKGLGEDLIYGRRKSWTEEKERILLGPFDYLENHPGKDFRSLCIAAFNKWLRVPAERLDVITRVVGMLHTASLL
jgi:geranylgeranyl diphosphate synthase type 3